ncbi:MAG: alpha/beta hydrolase [Gammaproteobacteria bacterium]|nr:alpha/beta hydrolase [Gammaproteobacteria bacterium]
MFTTISSLSSFAISIIIKTVFALLFIVCSTTSASAVVTNHVSIPISDLTGSIDNADGDPFAAYMRQLLQTELDKSGIQLQDNQLLTQFSTPKITGSGCTANVSVDPAMAEVRLAGGSTFNLDLNGIKDIVIHVNLSGSIYLSANASVSYGTRLFGRCREYATDSGVLLAKSNFNLNLTVNINLVPSYDTVNEWLVVDKHAQVSGGVNFSNTDIDGDFGGLNVTGLLIEATESALIKNFTQDGGKAITDVISETNNKLNGLDSTGVPDPSLTSVFNGQTIFELPPEIHDEEFTKLLIDGFGLPEILFDALDKTPGQVMYILLALDGEEKKQALAEFGSSLVCGAVKNYLELPLDTAPLYTTNNGVCEAASTIEPGTGGGYFTGTDCLQEVAFKPEDIDEYCLTHMSPGSKQLLGNAAAWPAETQVSDPIPAIKSQAWTTVLSTRLDIGTLPKDTLQQPFMKRVNYKTISNTGRGNGVCELEMRIYKSAINAENQPAILALHGGTWSSRGFAFLGLEAAVPSLVDQGFTVFVPFYRLAGDGDANPECNNAGWRDIISDTNDALAWVQSYGADFGTNNGPISVFGQSAGAHLAIWLALDNAQDIDKVLALYPPVDTLDFIRSAQSDLDADITSFGLRAFARLYGARNGASEINLGLLNVTNIDNSNLPFNLIDTIPNEAINLSAIDVSNPPRYLTRCATLTGIDYQQIDLTNPPDNLTACIKQDLADFVLESSFIHRLQASDLKMTVIQGSEDSLVPPQQAMHLCEQLSNVAIPSDLTDYPNLIELQCGTGVSLDIIQGAEHMLDFGICLGGVCPAGAEGSESRESVKKSLSNGFLWLGENDNTPASSNNAASTVVGGAGSMGIILLSLVLSFYFVIIKAGSRSRLNASEKYFDT